ncbi:hypothetical protein CL621_03800 [archaeon]|nr:hypothetical protein [archaeon]
MIVQPNFLKKIRSIFELNEYEVKIWTALLSKGVATTGELSEIGSVPRSRAYDVLESLEKKGFVVMKLGKPIKYIAVEPKEVIKRLKNKINKNSEDQIQRIHDMEGTNTFKDINLLYKNGINHIDMNELSAHIKGRNNLYEHISSMLKNAKDTVIISTTSDGLKRKYDFLKNKLDKLNKKGVKIRIFAPLKKNSKEIVDKFSEFATVKNMNKTNARFVIVDGKELLFMTNDGNVQEDYDNGIWVNSSFFAQSLEKMFNMGAK